VIIAVGGGSTMDTAKMIFLVYEQPNINFNTMMAPSFLGLRKKVFILAAIPTTSGTGSEATFVSVVTDTDRDPPKKTSVAAYELCPDFVVLNPIYTKSMPPYLTMGTGMDALAHAMGTYMTTMSSFYNDMHNLKAIEFILGYLPRAVKRGNDMEAREKMQLAAWLATSSIAGFDHGLGQSFGAIFHVHHGVSVALFLCAAVSFHSKVTDRFLDLAKLFKIKRKNRQKDEILRDLLVSLRNFMKKVGCPISIKELEDPVITYEEYMTKMDQLVHYADNDYTALSSTRPLNRETIRKLFEISYENNLEDLMELFYN
jgi:alcohol dehydrogenase class IV